MVPSGVCVPGPEDGQHPSRVSDVELIVDRQGTEGTAVLLTGMFRPENDEAFEWLDKAYQLRSDQLIYLMVAPRLDTIRSDP